MNLPSSWTCALREFWHVIAVDDAPDRTGIVTWAARPCAFALVVFGAQIMAVPALTQSTPAPIKMVVFDFELEDFSAGAGIPSKSAAEAAQLALATAKVRELIAQSGRYRLVDVTAADAKPVTDHSLRNCNGCDAEIALKLGAEQSLVGVITRISMTEYSVQNQIRDSRTGEVVARIGTDLRMGADNSWNRGAAWLIQNRLLGKPD
jgi:hypothetical protein